MSRVSVRYAKAFVEALSEKKRLSDADAFLGFCDVVTANRGLRLLLSNYAISPRIKSNVINGLAQRLALPELVVRFLSVLVKARRIDLLAELRGAVVDQMNLVLNIKPVQVTTASAPSREELDAISNSMEAHLGCKVQVHTQIDASILGGVVAQVGSIVYDGSVRGRLARLREELVKE
ncbi:ATP synthase F1 subunit delta [Acanthopleuribacter pedis]|uniref:ATP synthase subunit delta n=1 Tax=Acanthopleuribacter pedis TaxID=442870 RepID=A0A8J7Q0V0_9BACT|nr:ATP synthase F1 subunit delta [Acanthopleuribacter pedis]MBO1317160.1 ATP synthase F1 subunit delta [Acanthopleuribacter pedis]